MIECLQQNAEWMCAIGMFIFAGVQVWLMKENQKQELRLKRLELAKKLDEVFIHFPYEQQKCKMMIDWLISNRSLFYALLDEDGYKDFWEFVTFIGKLQERDKAHYIQKEDDDFFYYLNKLEKDLIKADYDLINLKGKIKT